MSELSLGALVFAAAVLVACGSGATTDPAEAPTPAVGTKPVLTVGRLFPLTVRGSQFRPRERVTVTLSGERTLTKRTEANRAGSFTVSFRTRVPRCGTVLVRARGSQGSRASYQLPAPDCRRP